MISGVTPVINPTVTTSYYVRAIDNTTTTTCVTANLTVDVPSAAPTVSASPDTVQCGVSSYLSGSSVNKVVWYTVSSGGTSIGSTVSSGTILVFPSSSPYSIYYAETQDISGCASLSRTPDTVTVVSFPAPTSVTASPSSLACGNSTTLSANTTASFINWYTVPSGGIYFGTSESGTNLVATPLSSTVYYAESGSGIPSNSLTFSYTGSIVNWTVPPGVTSITVDAWGAAGGYYSGTTPGNGARIVGTFSVSPGNVLSLLVGQCPGSTTLYSAGGGGSFAALGSSYATATPMIVAGGGGGSYSGGTGVNAPTSTSGTDPIPVHQEMAHRQ